MEMNLANLIFIMSQCESNISASKQKIIECLEEVTESFRNLENSLEIINRIIKDTLNEPKDKIQD